MPSLPFAVDSVPIFPVEAGLVPRGMAPAFGAAVPFIASIGLDPPFAPAFVSGPDLSDDSRSDCCGFLRNGDGLTAGAAAAGLSDACAAAGAGAPRTMPAAIDKANKLRLKAFTAPPESKRMEPGYLVAGPGPRGALLPVGIDPGEMAPLKPMGELLFTGTPRMPVPTG